VRTGSAGSNVPDEEPLPGEGLRRTLAGQSCLGANEGTRRSVPNGRPHVYSTTAPPGEAAFYGLSYESLGARLWASGPR